MWTVIICLCVAVIVVFAIRKISRENAEATSSAFTPMSTPTPLPTSEPSDTPHFDLVNDFLQEHGLFHEHPDRPESSSTTMIPTSTIAAGVEKFKTNYRGPRREQIVAVLDEGLAELKSRFGDQISAHDLREFIRTQRHKLMPRGN